MERRLASRELGRARRSIAAIKNFYLTNVILSLIIFGLTLMADAPMIWRVVMGSISAVMITGWLRIATEPFVWSLIIASIWTVELAARAYKGLFVLNLWTILLCIWTFGCWMMLPAASRATKLLAQYPDLWISKKMTGRATTRRSGARTRRR